LLIPGTNVVSEFMRDDPNPVVVAWLDRQARQSVWLTAISVMELNFGTHSLPPGRRKSILRRGLDRLVARKIGDRIAVFDNDAALSTANISAERQRAGRPGELRDSMIACIALSTGGSLATRNIRHFASLSITLIDPRGA
jgi:predicted nucleic acid-binding protein